MPTHTKSATFLQYFILVGDPVADVREVFELFPGALFQWVSFERLGFDAKTPILHAACRLELDDSVIEFLLENFPGAASHRGFLCLLPLQIAINQCASVGCVNALANAHPDGLDLPCLQDALRRQIGLRRETIVLLVECWIVSGKPIDCLHSNRDWRRLPAQATQSPLSGLIMPR